MRPRPRQMCIRDRDRTWTDDLAYQELYPALYCTPPADSVYEEKVIYLTFDDLSLIHI